MPANDVLLAEIFSNDALRKFWAWPEFDRQTPRLDIARTLWPMARRIRKVSIHRPGEDAQYSDAELLELLPSMLNAVQRKRRTQLVRRRNANNRRAANKKMTGNPRGAKAGAGVKRNQKICTEIKRNGEPCGQFQAFGTEHCRWHLTEKEKYKAGLSPDPSGRAGTYTTVPLLGAKTILTPAQVHRRVFEKAYAVMINKKLEIFGLTLEGYDPHGDPILGVLPGGGLKLHGESKDGDIIMTNFEDILGMNKVMDEMTDRILGKARQALTLEGGGKPIEVKPVRSGERAREVGSLLDQFGIIPRSGEPAHSGRQRRAPSERATPKVEEPDE